MLYRFLKILIGFGIRLYYKKIHINHIENLQNDGPRILIANHPNTLMDAWILGQICKEPIYFMTKGTFFSNKLKSVFLRSLGLIPINRATEVKTNGVDNKSSFESCYQLLEEGKTLVIFPEGNSFPERILRQLKTGTARIALEAEHRNKGKLNLKIIPIGLVYLQPEKFRSSVVANIGQAIPHLKYLKDFEDDNGKTSKKLTNDFKESMEALLIGSHAVEFEKLTDGIVELLSSRYIKSNLKGVEKDVDLYKEIYDKINRIIVASPTKMKRIEYIFNKIELQLHQLEIQADFLDRKYRPMMFYRQMIQSTILIFLGLPLFIYGFIHSILPFKLTDILVPKIVKDIEYYAPVAVLLGLVFYPFTYVSFLYLTDSIFHFTFWEEVAYFTSMPLMGMFAYYYYYYVKHVALKAHFIYMMNNEEEKVKSLQNDRELLRKLIFED